MKEISVEEAVFHLQTVYENDCKCSVKNFVLQCQEHNLLTKKKSRGKKRTIEEASAPEASATEPTEDTEFLRAFPLPVA